MLNLSHTLKSKFQPRLKSHKRTLDTHRNTLKDVLQQASQRRDRKDLLGRADLDSLQSDQQRERLLQGTNQLYDSGRRLEEAQRTAMETETIGAGILGNLRRQREQIVRTRDTVSTPTFNRPIFSHLD